MKNFKFALVTFVVFFAPLMGFAQAVSGFHPVTTQGQLTSFSVIKSGGDNIPNTANGIYNVYAADGTTVLGTITVTNGVSGPFVRN